MEEPVTATTSWARPARRPRHALGAFTSTTLSRSESGAGGCRSSLRRLLPAAAAPAAPRGALVCDFFFFWAGGARGLAASCCGLT